MTTLTQLSLALFLLSLFAFLAVFPLYPLYLYLRRASVKSTTAPRQPAGALPRVSLIVVVHNAATMIEKKISNCMALDYPEERLDIHICSDGSTDETVDLIRPFVSERLQLMVGSEQRGKAAVINEIAPGCSGDLLMFSDVDAILAPDSLKLLVGHFADDAVGGVSGARVIRENRSSRFAEPQKGYIFADSVIKLLESRSGSTTSNDGKLYIIRRALFRSISTAATDDLYTCLSVVAQGKRFLFEPAAFAYIGKPSQSAAHELARRRRIVCRSLHGIWSMRVLLNPFQFHGFAVGLFVNKVVRRALPFFQLVLLFSSLLLAFHFPLVGWLLALQLLFYLLALLHFIAIQVHLGLAPLIGRVTSFAFYFCLGSIGTLLGTVDFLTGRRYEKWEPLKAAAAG